VRPQPTRSTQTHSTPIAPPSHSQATATLVSDRHLISEPEPALLLFLGILTHPLPKAAVFFGGRMLLLRRL
jgi:hypothetical protein